MNKIFKTVWNRVRRCYVAVNETVSGAAQASGKTAVTIGVALTVAGAASTNVMAADTVTDSSISGSNHYGDVVFGGGVNYKNNVELTTNLAKDLPIGTEYETTEHLESDMWWYIKHSDKLKQIHDWVSDPDYRKQKLCGFELPNSEVTISNGSSITANTLTIGKSRTFLSGTIDFVTYIIRDLPSDYPETFRVWRVTDYGFNLAEINRAVETDINLINNGGSIATGKLIFSTENNAYTQNSGALSVGSFSGGGTATFKSGSLDVDTLTSDVKLTTENTRIDADTIDLNSKTWTSSNSNLSTGLDQVANFQQIIAKAQSLLIGSNDASRALNASVIKRNESVNGLLSKFKNNVTWSGGAFHFKGTYTQTVANQARQLIRGTYGSNVGVSFEQIVDDPTPADITNGLTAAIANAIMIENGTNGGAVFTEHKLNALANPITVGAAKGENNVDTSIGFVSVNGKSDVSVTGAKELVFLGEGKGSTIAEGKLIADNGTLRLGTKNTRAVVGGTVADVDLLNNGTFMVERGTFVAKDVAGEGNVLVSSGDLTIEKLDIQGRLTNKGNLHLAGVTTFENGANTGTLWSGDALINGTFSNDGGHWHLADKLRFGERAEVANGSGTLETVFGNLFDNGTGAEQDPLNTISLNASVPEEFKTVATDLFTHYVPGTVKDDVLKHMTFAGNGKVIISDASLTTTQRDDLVKAFKEKFSVFPRVFRS